MTSIAKEKSIVYTPRYYQKEAIDIGVDHLLSGNKPCVLVEPTGSGKSILQANIAGKLNDHVLCFSPSKEILEQNFAKLKMYYPDADAEIFSASMNSKKIGKLTFATIGSVYRKPDLFKHFKYIIIDECDMGMNAYTDNMYKQFLTSLGRKPLLGMTATPFKLYHNSLGAVNRFITRTSPKVFYDIIHHTQIQTLSDEGYLAKYEYYRVNGFDTNQIRVNSTKTDYVDSSLQAYYKSIKFDNSILDISKRLINAGRNHILVFTKFVDEARLLAKDLGNIAAIVHGAMPMAERTQILNDFKSGKIKIVCNVGVLVVGFDFPELDTIVLGSPMRSLRQFYQKVGRGARPHIFKKSTWVIDLCQNMNRFCPINDMYLCKDRRGLWQFIDFKTKRPITNVYFN
jgi:DNA repair protein RadD